ncbi:hypothetical protein, partial [Kribbella albertanoniae]|uniref:hypothetical protein n=1 Tax=Kribbella albertanoniae TaxID=1266829 RepID=UPI001EDF5898
MATGSATRDQYGTGEGGAVSTLTIPGTQIGIDMPLAERAISTCARTRCSAVPKTSHVLQAPRASAKSSFHLARSKMSSFVVSAGRRRSRVGGGVICGFGGVGA